MYYKLEVNFMQIDSNEVRKAMRCWATGVTVVTAQHQGVRHGMTVSAFTSASLNPPLVLVSMSRDSRTHAMVTETGSFGVTILSSEQQAIAECFSGQGCEDESRFVGLE